MSEYSFVDLVLGESVEKCGNLIQALESLMPSSVQMINLIRVKQRGMFASERVTVFQLLSYEPEKGPLEAASRDWMDQSKPLFLVCLIGTLYNIEGESQFQYRMMYSRETPSPQDCHLVGQFSKCFDFSRNEDVIFAVMDKPRYLPFLEVVLSSVSRTATAYPNWTMYLCKEKAKGFGTELENIKDGSLSIRSLEPDHASIVNSSWKFGNRDGTLVHIRDQIVHSISAGIFLDGTDLACWVISMPTGTINALHTRADCRRRGLGEWAMKYISFNLAQSDVFPIVEIEPESAASKDLMTKLGFVLAYNAAWVYCKRV